MSYCCQDKKYFSELCPACVKAMSAFSADSLDYPHYTEYSSSEWPGSEVKSQCECGSKAVNGPGHSHWCPEYDNR